MDDTATIDGVLVLRYPPSVNHMYRRIGRGVVLLPESRDWREDARWRAMAAGWRPVAGPVGVRIDLYRPRRRGDLDNSIKAILDALNGIAWHDDGQVERLDVRRYDDPGNPRAEVIVLGVGAHDASALWHDGK